tara:strand:+ start:129005 stop:129154 length:150 start_codon:yes stop_codon:yes gene_type:complete
LPRHCPTSRGFCSWMNPLPGLMWSCGGICGTWSVICGARVSPSFSPPIT